MLSEVDMCMSGAVGLFHGTVGRGRRLAKYDPLAGFDPLYLLKWLAVTHEMHENS